MESTFKEILFILSFVVVVGGPLPNPGILDRSWSSNNIKKEFYRGNYKNKMNKKDEWS